MGGDPTDLRATLAAEVAASNSQPRCHCVAASLSLGGILLRQVGWEPLGTSFPAVLFGGHMLRPGRRKLGQGWAGCQGVSIGRVRARRGQTVSLRADANLRRHLAQPGYLWVPDLSNFLPKVKQPTLYSLCSMRHCRVSLMSHTNVHQAQLCARTLHQQGLRCLALTGQER